MFRLRGLHPSSLVQVIGRSLSRLRDPSQAHVFFCIADHYEPMAGGVTAAKQIERVQRWCDEYPKSVAGLSDSQGRAPQHSFFYPIEEYDERLVEMTSTICRGGLGSLEFHLHHDGDSPQQFRDRLERAKEQFDKNHGALQRDAAGRLKYGFIHGNWALCNSLPDGRWCGVNDELTILRETGCYADFTMPAAPIAAQTRIVNSIYYAKSSPDRPRSHDVGIPAAVGLKRPEDRLLLIQGPLMLNWRSRKWGVIPRLENSDIHGGFAPTAERLDLWLRAGVGVLGKPEWIFIKLHTHGAPERNASVLLSGEMRDFHRQMAEVLREHDAALYYVNAREMANAVHEAERGTNLVPLAN